MKLVKRRVYSSISILLAFQMVTCPPAIAGGAPWTILAASDEAIAAAKPAVAADSAPAEPVALRFSTAPSDAEIFSARLFDEPLVPLNSDVRSDENRALADALTAYSTRTDSDDCSSLAAYASGHPDSRWTGPLLLQLGLEYYNYGYFSKALDAWQRAWDLCRNIQSGPAKPEADRALGELARMYSRLGRVAELSQLLDSTRERNLEGPATQLIHAATEALWLMQNKPDYNFGCGPSALDRILLRTDPSKAGSSYLLECKSGTNGFSLPEVADISVHLGMNYQMAFREPGAPLIIPAVVHWKVDHYAALVARQGNRVLSQDYTFRGSVWMTTTALDEESSGYFLVPPGPLPRGWRSVSAAEGQRIRGKGDTDGENTDGTGDPDTTCAGPTCQKCKRCKDKANGTKPQSGNGGGLLNQAIDAIQSRNAALSEAMNAASDGMTTYSFHALLVSLTLEDTPVRFNSPVGPQVTFTATYNQLEANQPATFYYSNLGPKWDCSWLTYVTDNPSSPGSDAAVYLDGGGTIRFSNFNPTNQTYTLEPMTQTLLVRTSPSSYELQFPDGSKREYTQSDGSTGSTRRIFLTQTIDPFGNTVQFNYDSQLRITNVVNAIGQAMTLLYTNAAYPFAITSVTDPFGRTAYLQYNSNGLLTQITDVLGLVSQYTYGANQFVNALTTPYGTTTFSTGPTNGGSFLMATDPLGGTELLETSQSLPVPDALPAAQVPHGLSTFNLFMEARDSFFWDKKAYAEGAWDWSKATIYHWLHQSPNGQVSARILESVKEPLEARVWYNYPGEYTNLGAPYYLDAAYSGATDQPSAVARVLDDGSTQLASYGYNAQGNATNVIDPLGRNFTYIYSTNNIDLIEVHMTHNGKNELMEKLAYNSQHLPVSSTDAAGQTSTKTYNSRGQLLTITDPQNNTTTFTYDTNGFLISVDGPLPGSSDSETFTYDALGRRRTATDTEGYTVTYSYDNFDRLTALSFPDGTSEQYVYDRLDLAASRDRLGRWTTNSYDADRQLVAVRDPLGQVTRFSWCLCGALEGITDPMGRTTSWTYDIEGRPVTKTYPDGSQESYTYENNTGRLKVFRDPLGQQTVFDYYADDSLRGVSYPNAVIPTPAVTFTYDPDYARVTSMSDGIGTTMYSYYPISPVPTLGAGQVETVSGPVPNSSVTYQYDALGRVVSRAINGVAESTGFDPLGRRTGDTNALGAFYYAFVDATPRVASVACPNGQTNLFSYYGILGDERLQQIRNLKPDGSLLSGLGYTYNAVGEITSWTNTWDTLPSRVWLFGYDALNRLTAATRTDGVNPISTNSYTYDPAGNRTLATASGATNGFSFNSLNQVINGANGLATAVTYEWDAAHRLTAINQGAHRTEFSYDGLDRRTRIVEKQSGATVANNYFVWCDTDLCEERDATGFTVQKRFFPQGEVDIGGATTNLFYTRDHLGSVREVLSSAGVLQSRFDYDPYGQQSTLLAGSGSSFGFAGYYQHAPSGLNLTLYRALDFRSGRWLSRDPLGEAAGLNLYAYANNDPVNATDPQGALAPLVGWAIGLAIGEAISQTTTGNEIFGGIYTIYQKLTGAWEQGKRLNQLKKMFFDTFSRPCAYVAEGGSIEKVQQAIIDEIRYLDPSVAQQLSDAAANAAGFTLPGPNQFPGPSLGPTPSRF